MCFKPISYLSTTNVVVSITNWSSVDSLSIYLDIKLKIIFKCSCVLQANHCDKITKRWCQLNSSMPAARGIVGTTCMHAWRSARDHSDNQSPCLFYSWLTSQSVDINELASSGCLESVCKTWNMHMILNCCVLCVNDDLSTDCYQQVRMQHGWYFNTAARHWARQRYNAQSIVQCFVRSHWPCKLICT